MEEDKLKESKKILTDYMLELNADIQRAEDWVNTGADEDMYFAIKTVIDELERLQKELDKYKNVTYYEKLENKELEKIDKKRAEELLEHNNGCWLYIQMWKRDD